MLNFIKENLKKVIIILAIILIIIIGFFLVKKFVSHSDDTNNYNILMKEAKGIEAKAYISSGGNRLIISAINKSDKTIGSGNIKVSYYDENNNKIRIYGTDDTRYNMFEKDNEIVYSFELPTAENLYYIPAKTEVEITIDEEYQEKYSSIISKYSEDFSYSYSTNTDDSLTITLKNNSNSSKYAPRSVSIVFYKNNKPVFSSDILLHNYVEAGQVVSEKVKVPSDYKLSKETGKDILIDYDSVKIYRIVDGNS